MGNGDKEVAFQEMAGEGEGKWGRGLGLWEGVAYF